MSLDGRSSEDDRLSCYIDRCVVCIAEEICKRFGSFLCSPCRCTSMFAVFCDWHMQKSTDALQCLYQTDDHFALASVGSGLLHLSFFDKEGKLALMLLCTKNLSKQFKRRGDFFYAVEDINFSVEEASFTFIVGRSGSGKTTFLNLISALLNPTQGEVWFCETNVHAMSEKEKSLYRNESIGFVPQGLGSLPNLSVLDNVRLPFFLFKRDGDDEGRALSLLEMMGIMHLKDELPSSLSGGEEKRMLIARALMNNPRLLIADEPTANLDSETSKEVMEAIHRARKEGVAALIVTHDASIISNDASIYKMNAGKLEKEK